MSRPVTSYDPATPRALIFFGPDFVSFFLGTVGYVRSDLVPEAYSLKYPCKLKKLLDYAVKWKYEFVESRLFFSLIFFSRERSRQCLHDVSEQGSKAREISTHACRKFDETIENDKKIQKIKQSMMDV